MKPDGTSVSTATIQRTGIRGKESIDQNFYSTVLAPSNDQLSSAGIKLYALAPLASVAAQSLHPKNLTNAQPTEETTLAAMLLEIQSVSWAKLQNLSATPFSSLP